jgi:hypothetical protein
MPDQGADARTENPNFVKGVARLPFEYVGVADIARVLERPLIDHAKRELNLTPDPIESVFAAHARDVAAEQIGIVEREIRSGYSGFIFLTGIAR